MGVGAPFFSHPFHPFPSIPSIPFLAQKKGGKKTPRHHPLARASFTHSLTRIHSIRIDTIDTIRYCSLIDHVDWMGRGMDGWIVTSGVGDGMEIFTVGVFRLVRGRSYCFHGHSFVHSFIHSLIHHFCVLRSAFRVFIPRCKLPPPPFFFLFFFLLFSLSLFLSLFSSFPSR